MQIYSSQLPRFRRPFGPVILKGDPAPPPPVRDGVTLSPAALQATSPLGLTDKELQAHAERLVRDNLERVPEYARGKARSRHLINGLVQSQSPGEKAKKSLGAHYDGSPVVVIAFEGTGAFDARRPALMQQMGRELQAEGRDTTDPRFAPEKLLDKALAKQRGRGAKWSGLASGPLSEIVKDKELNNNIQWLSFPSEEAEVLSDPEAYKNLDIRQLVSDIRRSSSGTSQGINSALARVGEISRQAEEQGKSPRFVILSHSSGGRSAVKFVERLKNRINPATGQPYQVDLAVTIDPVREAHEAVFEAAREVVNKKTEHGWNKVRSLVGLEKKKVYPPNVGSRRQPESLFHSDGVLEWVNFYQMTDTEGLKMPIKFGIHGSPIDGAENHQIHDTRSDGHGAIAYHRVVLERIKLELRELVRE